MTDVRAAWNTMHGTELPHHDDILTAEQAARINAYYRIEVYTGTHGRGHAEFGYLANPLVAMLLPTQVSLF